MRNKRIALAILRRLGIVTENDLAALEELPTYFFFEMYKIHLNENAIFNLFLKNLKRTLDTYHALRVSNSSTESFESQISQLIGGHLTENHLIMWLQEPECHSQKFTGEDNMGAFLYKNTLMAHPVFEGRDKDMKLLNLFESVRSVHSLAILVLDAEEYPSSAADSLVTEVIQMMEQAIFPMLDEVKA